MSRVPSAKDVLDATHLKDGDIARKLAVDYGINTGQPLINRWRNGREPNAFSVTVAILDLAGMLKTANGETHPIEALPSDPLAAVVVGMAALLQNQALALRVLGVPETEIVLPEIPPMPQPARQARRRRTSL